ncbi:MAG: preprotein translocase subunit SecG [bacterium]|nr:preprotein translocase subunit SecG [bacterium]
MTTLIQILPYIQIALSVILIALVLLQQSEADLGSAFGGGDSLNTPSHTRRGLEKGIFVSTIVVAILFAASSLVAILFR